MGTISCAVQHGMKTSPTRVSHEQNQGNATQNATQNPTAVKPPSSHTYPAPHQYELIAIRFPARLRVFVVSCGGRCTSDSLSSGGALPRHCCGAGGICTKRYRVASTCAFMGDTGRHATIQIFQSPYNYRQVKRVARVGTARRHSPHGHKNGLPGQG